MRFERLDILRYGALTDRSLAFRPDARLHIVYGPNEAGKSSALSAISDLLFGFPAAAQYSFQHDPAALRVGATISSQNGAQVSFRRRRGRKSTLLAAGDAEEALPDDALTPFLGTLGRDVFERAFGLNSLSLRAGGESMLKSGGEIGSLLFSAASGLTGLADLRKELEGEADSIYAPRRSKDRLFYQVLDAHEEARRAERESELKSGDWKKLLSEQAEVAAELEQVSGERQEVRRALERLRRLQRLDPIIREIDRERAQLAAFSALAGLSADFEARLASLLERLRENGDARRRAEGDVARLREEIAAIHVDGPLVAASAAVMAAHADKGVYQKAREDIARVRGEVEDFDQRLLQAARRLGLSASDDLEGRQPPDAELARLRTQVDEGTALDRRLRDVRQRLVEQHEALRRLRSDAASGRLVDPKPWAEQLAALQPDLADLQRIEMLQVKLARAEADLAAAVSRLDPPVADLRRLAAVPLPEPAELSNHRRVIEQMRVEARNAASRAAGLEEQAAAIGRQLAALEGAGRIVSRDDLLASRGNRDAVLDQLRLTPELAGFDRLASAIDHADRMADSALADAERVTRHAELTLRQSELQRAVEEAGPAVRDAEIALSDAVTDYEDGFRTSGIRPASPERMIEWRRAVEELFRQLRDVEGLRDECDALRLKDKALRPVLLSLADAVGLAAVALPTLAVGRGVERRLAEIAQDWMDSRSGEAKRAMAEEAIVELERREQALLAEVARWRSLFSAAVAAVGLCEDADTAMALAALEAWRTVPGILSERQNRQRRVRGMTRDMEAFEEAATPMLRRYSQ